MLAPCLHFVCLDLIAFFFSPISVCMLVTSIRYKEGIFVSNALQRGWTVFICLYTYCRTNKSPRGPSCIQKRKVRIHKCNTYRTAGFNNETTPREGIIHLKNNAKNTCTRKKTAGRALTHAQQFYKVCIRNLQRIQPHIWSVSSTLHRCVVGKLCFGWCMWKKKQVTSGEIRYLRFRVSMPFSGVSVLKVVLNKGVD